jgi:hypothetical protein
LTTDDKTTLPEWERQKGETDKAWAAFEAFRDAGRNRTIESAHRALLDSTPSKTSENVQKRPKIAPGNWTVWARDFRWYERAAAWDREQARLIALEVEAQRKAHVQKLLDDLYSDADTSASAARIMLRKALERFKTVDMATYPADKLPQLITSLARLLAIAGDLRYVSLGLDELAQQYMADQKDADGS